MIKTITVGMKNTNIYYRKYRMRLDKSFRDMDNLFIHWIDNIFGTNSCIDQRFIKNHIADFDVERKLFEQRIFFSLNSVDNQTARHLQPDLRIVAITGPCFGIKRWIIGFDKLAFDFDPLVSIQINLMEAKLTASFSDIKTLGYGATGAAFH